MASARTSIALALCMAALLAGCASPTQQADGSLHVGERCVASAQCATPTDYLIRSNCPFGAACVEGACAVVCPVMRYDPRTGEGSAQSCTSDSMCDCSERGNATLRCACVAGACVSVEAR